MRVNITWVTTDGRAAGLGLDERGVESVGTLDDARQAAEDYAAEQGVDLNRYRVEVTEVVEAA